MTRIEWAVNMTQDEHWMAVLDEFRQAQYSRFADSDPLDIDAREDAFRRLRVIDEIQAHIESLAMSAAIKEKRWKIL